jgi:hypothetical protein
MCFLDVFRREISTYEILNDLSLDKKKIYLDNIDDFLFCNYLKKLLQRKIIYMFICTI